MQNSVNHEISTPSEHRSRQRRLLTIAGYITVVVLILGATAQFQRGTIKNLRKYEKALAADQNHDTIKRHKGAIGRWRFAVHQFWDGHNIYQAPESGINGAHSESEDAPNYGPVWLHPNAPAIVILLTPFAYLPVWLMAISFNLLKIAILIPTIYMAARLAQHHNLRIPPWAALLGLVAAVKFLISDIQHGNTNIFVAAAVITHLYLFRNRRDLLSGATLAFAVLLKMTPAFLLLYWLYQRQWKVLAGLLVGLIILGFIFPAGILGWDRYSDLTSEWYSNLIRPGLVEGAWYPVHINQSLPGMIARYFLADESGNYLWNPDDEAVASEHAWMTVIDLGPQNAKLLMRAIQIILLALAAWAIGWRKLPRHDARRALHYGILVSLMLLLNQRSWDHHAGYLLVASMAIVYACAFGRLSPLTKRITAIILGGTVAALLILGKDVLLRHLPPRVEDLVEAYGRTFWHFLAVYGLCVFLALKLKKPEPPYIAPATADKSTRRGNYQSAEPQTSCP